MTWLTVTEYPCYIWPRICSFCRNYNQVLFSLMFMTYHRVYIKSNTTGATFGVSEFASSFELYLWGLCDHVVKLHLFTFLVSCCDVRYAQKRCSVRFHRHLFCLVFMFYSCYLYLFTHTGVQLNFDIIPVWCSCCFTVTRRVSPMEQELLTPPELSEINHGFFSRVRVAQSLVFV